MSGDISVSDFSEGLTHASCPFCQNKFDIGQQIVQCPVCGCWHHLKCWRCYDNRCSALNCPGHGRLQAQAVPSTPDETDVRPDDDVTEPASVFIRADLVPNTNILDEITIFDDTPLDIRIYDTPDSPGAQTTGEELDDFSISSYELFLDEVSQKIKLNRFLEKTGVQNVIKRYVKGKDYYIALGAVLVWGVLLCIIGIIVIIVIGFALFG